MPGSSSWMPYAPQGVKGLDNDDDDRIKYSEWNTKGIKISCKRKRNLYIIYSNTNNCERMLKEILCNFKKHNNRGNKITQ